VTTDFSERVKVELLGQTRVQLYTLGQLLGPSDFWAALFV